LYDFLYWFLYRFFQADVEHWPGEPRYHTVHKTKNFIISSKEKTPCLHLPARCHTKKVPRLAAHFLTRGRLVYRADQLRRGEKFVWVLRFTAVVVCEADGWKFAQMNFSFPTVYFPDVRLME